MRRFWRVLIGKEAGWGFDSWERVEFDLRWYDPLRNSGLSHRETIAELDRRWKARAT